MVADGVSFRFVDGKNETDSSATLTDYGDLLILRIYKNDNEFNDKAKLQLFSPDASKINYVPDIHTSEYWQYAIIIHDDNGYAINNAILAGSLV